MKRRSLIIMILTTVLAASVQNGHSQLFNSGSDGSLGALVTTNGQVPLNMPSNGVFNFTTITVNTGHILKFNRNALNTPVYLLATGDVVINGEINVSGSGNGTGTAEPCAGGPGGFDGGRAGSDGQGPGGGRTGSGGGGLSAAGGGAYATAPSVATTNKGAIYGSTLVIPLIGGSGGGGNSFGGGGGGGAILIASSTRIQISGAIWSNGGGPFSGINGGSGGAIRLVAPAVSGSGRLDTFQPDGTIGGSGRLRIDVMDRTGLNPFVPGGSYTIGSFMTVFPPGNPRLDITQAADVTIPEGTNSPVVITLPFGSDTNRTVTVQARNFGTLVPIEVAITPQLGSSFRIQTNIDNSTINPATVTIPVGFPANTPNAVTAWTR